MEGGIYLVTFTTTHRQPLFAHDGRAALAASILAHPHHWPTARLLAWVLMPDHWHGMVQLAGTESLSRCISRIKAATTRGMNTCESTTVSPWAPGFHDRALRRDESAVDCARYIVSNPIRAGLVSRCGDYPYWDAVWLEDALDKDLAGERKRTAVASKLAPIRCRLQPPR